MSSSRRVTLFFGLVVTLMVLLFAGTRAQASAPELFISEYIEGSSFNKAIEIYNGTGSAVDLAVYTVELYSNGAASPSQSVALSGTIANGDVFVVAHGSADAAILAEADLISSAVINFNGDDAIVLRKNGVVIDAFGQTGFDPGTQWPGGGQDDTLRRAETICAGDTNAEDTFDASLEWVTFSINTFDGLGSHTTVCGGATELFMSEYIEGSSFNKAIEIYNGTGSAVDLDASIYTLELYSNGAASPSQSVVLSGTIADGDVFVVAHGSADAAILAEADLISSAVINFNGDDAIVLRKDGAVIDAFGQIGVDPGSQWSGGGQDDTLRRAETICAGDTNAEDAFDASLEWVTFSINIFDGLGSHTTDCGGGGTVVQLSCDDASVITLIHEIQGSGLSSALVGNSVVIDGVVVGDFQNNASADNGDLNGFYVQEEDSDADADASTSEGVFVFAATTDVAVGDHVRVAGTVVEYSTSSGASLMTELSNTEVAVCATPAAMPTATEVVLPVASLPDLERYEGMLVTFSQNLVISEYFNFDRFGEIVLSTERQFTPTAVVEPGVDATALAATQALARITLDDGRSTQNPDPAIHPNGNVFDLTNTFRGGDLVQGLTGVMDDTFGLYRVQPVQGANYTSVNPRTAAPDPVGGSLQVASFNVLNYFNGDGMGGGFPTSRGANDLDEFNRQRDKIIAAIATIDADVVGLMEIENDGYDGLSAIADLVNGLNAATAPGTYAYLNPGVPVIGTDEIAVGLIYKPGNVTPFGSSAILDSSVDARFDDTKNRPALAQSFMENSNGAVFTVVVNHLKSKGSSCDDVGDPDLGDGAGNCNITRRLAAEALVDWLATDPTGSGDPDALIIGDLNSYDKEDPIDAILAGSDDLAGSGDDYADLAFAFGGEFAYSYVFDGKLGYLDYALANNSLFGQVTGTTEWHINSDEPDILDYDTSFKQDAQDALYEPNAYRASDHDPVIVGLNLNVPPVCTTAVPSVVTLWSPNHQFVPISVLGVTDADGDPITIVIDSIFQDEAVDAPGSGNTSPDGQGLGTATAEVRAERAGNGNGRYYHIAFTAADGQGNFCSSTVAVSVPKSKGNNGTAVDDGSLYDSTVMP